MTFECFLEATQAGIYGDFARTVPSCFLTCSCFLFLRVSFEESAGRNSFPETLVSTEHLLAGEPIDMP